VVALQGGRQVVDFEGRVRNGLHQLGLDGVGVITLPLDTDRIVLVIAHRDSKMRKGYFALEGVRGGNADVIETPPESDYLRGHGSSIPAEVRMKPSLSTKRTSGSTCTSGNRRARSPVSSQCVVARLPSSRPAAAPAGGPGAAARSPRSIW